MRQSKVVAITAGVAAASLLLAACSSSKKSGTSGSSASLAAGCEAYSAYAGHSGKKVTIYASITDPEAGYIKSAWKQFTDCTGINIQYTGDKEFETQLKVKVQGGNAPDLAIIPQPGLLASFATSGKLKVASDALTTEAKKNWSQDWINYTTVNGKFYGAPLGANVKSFVWYSPKYFKEKGYTVPTTWDDMIALSSKIADGGTKPWCVGIESGTATGWPLTDWMEEVMLRLHGPDVYDQWVQHKIPFNDPQVADVLAKVGEIVKNDKYVNAGIGDVKSISTTAFAKAGLPIEKGKCYLHAQASFYAANWDKGIKVAPDGDVYAFYEPPISDKFGKPIEGGGEFVGAFSDKPEVQAVQLYLASGEYATSLAKINPGRGITANKNVDKTAFAADPIASLSVQLLTDPKTTFRFDGSDAMPGVVGAGTFWTNMTQWILGNQDDKKTLDNIEASWPK
jgi:alpha-glucoside transport system substrate-binding protein